MLKTGLPILVTAILVCLCAVSQPATASDPAPRISKEELRSMLGSSNLVIIDVRADQQWEQSEEKIPGAVHEQPFQSRKWGAKYDTDKTIVTY